MPNQTDYSCRKNPDNTPLISVIIPAYNADKTITHCLRSVFAQTYPNIEVIFVDDGSSDQTGHIADAVSAKNPQMRIFHIAHHGLAMARNTGLENAAGEFIFFMDADDWIEPDTLQDLYERIIAYDADMAMTGTVTETDDGLEISKTHDLKKRMNRDEYLTCYTLRESAAYVRVWGKLFKKDLFRGVTFPIGKRHEDVYAFPAIYQNLNRAVFSDRFGYHYVQHSGSIMHSLPSPHTFDAVDAACSVFDSFLSMGYTKLLPGAEGKIYAAMRRMPAGSGFARYYMEAKDKHLTRIRKLQRLHLYSLRSRIRNTLFYMGVRR